MKKNLLSFILIGAFASAGFAQITNAGFETWAVAGNCSSPNGWGTLNGSTAILGICTAQPYTSAPHSGSNALLINTQFIGFPINQTAPGIVTNGTINTTTQSVEGGQAFTERPTAFTGWYKASPVNGDTYSFGALLINETTGDTVGVAGFEGTTTVNSWTEFTATVDYSSPDNATLLQIILLPSDPTNPQVGSVAYFDDLGYETVTVGLHENDAQSVRTYPNPVVNRVFFSLQESERVNISIYNILGVMVHQQYLNASNNVIDVANLPSGTYVWHMSAINGSDVQSGKLIISK